MLVLDNDSNRRIISAKNRGTSQMETSTVIPIISSENKVLFRVEARSLGGREKVSALRGVQDEEFKTSVESLARSVAEVIQKVSPTKATAEFSVEIALESGKLTALLVKGSGKANLKITLEWAALPNQP
jgi:hypothetical protein